jgi:cytochrome c oxidase subunit I+III
LSAYGFWSFALGGIFVCGSIFFGVAPRGGWFMYPPLSSAIYDAGLGAEIWLLGLSFIEVASIAAAVELIVGILKCRAPGMRINLMPLYCWYVLVVAVMILFAFPPLIAGDLLLELERTLGWPFFDPRRGGDPLLWQHLFWIFGHPEVYIISLPSAARVGMMVPTFARRPIVGYPWIVLAAVGTGFLSFGLWVHHMFTTGLPGISLALFSAASSAVAIPTAVQIFAFIATIFGVRLARSLPMLFIFGSLATFVIGGLTGVMVALVPFNFQAHDSYFVVAHLHSVLIGGTIFPILAAFHYYFPLITAKKLADGPGRVAFWLIFIGFNVTFMPMHWTGMRGMARRVFTYPPALGFEWLNLISSIGAFILALGFAVFLWNAVRSMRRETYSERNPWGAGTLEWLAEMPSHPWGIRSIPEIDGRYPLWNQPDLMRHVDDGRFYLPDAEEGKRETLITSPIDAKPRQCLRVAGPTFLTFFAALFTGGVFIFSTFHWWWSALVSGVAALAVIVLWLWTGTSLIPEKPEKHVGLGLTLPLYATGSHSVGWWAMLITMLGAMTAYISLVFGYFFYWTSRPDFVSNVDGPGTRWPLIGLTLALAAWALTVLSRHSNKRNAPVVFYVSIAFAAILAGGSALALLTGPVVTGMDPKSHVYAATVWVLVIWTVAQIAAGIVMHAYCAARRLAGRLNDRYDIDIATVTLYWHFAAITTAMTVAVIAGFPLTL